MDPATGGYTVLCPGCDFVGRGQRLALARRAVRGHALREHAAYFDVFSNTLQSLSPEDRQRHLDNWRRRQMNAAQRRDQQLSRPGRGPGGFSALGAVPGADPPIQAPSFGDLIDFEASAVSPAPTMLRRVGRGRRILAFRSTVGPAVQPGPQTASQEPLSHTLWPDLSSGQILEEGMGLEWEDDLGPFPLVDLALPPPPPEVGVQATVDTGNMGVQASTDMQDVGVQVDYTPPGLHP